MLTYFLVAVLIVNVACSELAGAALNFSDRLFEGSLQYAKRSLQGRFIDQMVEGTLPNSAFHRYLHQDNLYLGKYARAFAVLAARADKTDEFVWLLNVSAGYLREHHGHDATMDSKIFDQEAMPVTVAYTSFFSMAAWSESPLLAYASLLPCQRLYDWLFATLKAMRHIADDNPYKAYVDQYADPKNHGLTKAFESFVDRHVKDGISEELATRAHEYYNRAMQYEAEFFAQGLQDGGSTEVGTSRSLRSRKGWRAGPGWGGAAQPRGTTTWQSILM